MADQDKINDIVKMLDEFVTDGGGHMNIKVQDPEQVEEVLIDTYRSLDCSSEDMACGVPTLHQGLDEDEYK